MKTTLLFSMIIYSALNMAFADEKYDAPTLSLKEGTTYSKPQIKGERWEIPTKIEAPIHREIASEKKKGRKPSSKTPLFRPWIYKAIP